MRQIINLQLGLCGNQIGLDFLSTISQQHRITPSGQLEPGISDRIRTRIDVFFNEVRQDQYQARNILVDLQPGSIDTVRGSRIGHLYNPDNFVVGLGSSGNNWAVGYYGKGQGLIDTLMDKVRDQADNCDHLEGIQLIHSIMGGTGSGLGSLVLQKIKDEYPGIIIQTFTVAPSPKASEVIVGNYNAAFSLGKLVNHANLVHLNQNQALFEICKTRYKIDQPTYQDANKVVASVMANITAGLRFPGEINLGLRKQAVNLVPFPRLHFLMDAVSYVSKDEIYKRKYAVDQFFGQLFNSQSVLCCSRPYLGRYMTASAIVRGNISTKQVEQKCLNVQDKSTAPFVEWIPNNIQCSICHVPLPGYQLSGTFTGNNYAIQQTFKDICENFSSLRRRKAFLHSYLSEGMDELEFREAESNIKGLINQYQDGVIEDYQYENEEPEEDKKQPISRVVPIGQSKYR